MYENTCCNSSCFLSSAWISSHCPLWRKWEGWKGFKALTIVLCTECRNRAAFHSAWVHCLDSNYLVHYSHCASQNHIVPFLEEVLFSVLLPFIMISMHRFLSFVLLSSAGWICQWVCWGADWRGGVPAADQTRSWEQRHQFLYADCNQGEHWVLFDSKCPSAAETSLLCKY